MPEPFAIIDPVNGHVFVEGYGDMTHDVAIELAALRKADLDRVAAKADRRQRYLARECAEAHFLPGGQIVGQIDEGVFQHWIDRYGSKFWSDKSNRRWFLKRHPECRVRSAARNLTLLVQGARGAAVAPETERRRDGETERPNLSPSPPPSVSPSSAASP